MRGIGVAVVLAVAASLAVARSAESTTTTQRSSGPFTYVTSSDPAPSGDFTESAACPAGANVVGGGGSIGRQLNVDDNSALTTSIHTLAGTTGWIAGGVNTEGVGEHTSTAVAVCMTNAAQSSLDYFTNPGLIQANGTLGSSFGCPINEKVIGGGADLGTPAADVTLNESYPPRDTAWDFAARNAGATPRSVSEAIICIGSDAARIRYALRSVLIGAKRFGTAKAACPSRFRVAGGGLATDVDGALVASIPFDGRDAGRAPDDGWRVSVENGASHPIAGTAYAVCMRL